MTFTVRSSDDRPPGRTARPSFLGMLSGFVIVATILFVTATHMLDRALSRSIAEDAADRAGRWVGTLSRNLDGFSTLVRDGAPSPRETSAIGQRLAYGDVHRLRILDLDGRVLHDTGLDGAMPAREPSGTGPVAVADDGRTVGRLREGSGASGRPLRYVEVRVPFTGADGLRRMAVVETDVTGLWAALDRRHTRLAMGFVLFGLAAYAVPAGILFRRARRFHDRDRRLLWASQHDELTGLLHRRTAVAHLGRLARSAAATGRKCAVLYVDLDGLKAVNDELGHAAGDAMLAEVARRMLRRLDPGMRTMGPRHVAARFGGDEFVAAIAVETEEAARRMAEKILSDLTLPFVSDGRQLRPGASIGLAVATGTKGGEPMDIHECVRRADAALYAAKSDGRGRVVTYDDRVDAALRRHERIHSRLLRGLDDDAFYLEFQPIFCSQAEQIIGFEALMRMRDGDGQPLGPAEFIAVAEDTGLIETLGELVLDKALAAASGWPDDIFVAVNVSAIQFGSGRLVGLVENLLTRHGVAAERLEIELTESVLTHDIAQLGEELAELKGLGVRLALDDFGTGYSSLAYLWRLPFDTLKIDRAFLEGFEFHSETYRAFIATISLLGHQLGMRVTAEGLETTDQLAMLETLGIDAYQGYLLARPLPADIAHEFAHDRPPPPLLVLSQ